MPIGTPICPSPTLKVGVDLLGDSCRGACAVLAHRMRARYDGVFKYARRAVTSVCHRSRTPTRATRRQQHIDAHGGESSVTSLPFEIPVRMTRPVFDTRANSTETGEVVAVKLAEALAERAAATRRVEQLRARVVSNARYQEGETPAENAAQLLAEADEVLATLEVLIRRINRTNATVEMGQDGTLTDALARRDVLRLRHSVVTAAADAAAGTGDRGYGRQLRSELMVLSALPVAELRARADVLAKEIREVDVRIQRTNWEVDLLD